MIRSPAVPLTISFEGVYVMGSSVLRTETTHEFSHENKFLVSLFFFSLHLKPLARPTSLANDDPRDLVGSCIYFSFL